MLNQIIATAENIPIDTDTNIWFVDTEYADITATIIVTIPETTCLIYEDEWFFNNISMELDVPETSCAISCDESIEFDLPETTMTAAGYADIMADISGHIGKTTMKIVADTAIVAVIEIDTPVLIMEAFCDAVILAQFGASTMIATTTNDAIVNINATAPKTKLSITAINQAVANIEFDLLQTLFSGTAASQEILNLSGTVGLPICVISAINGVVCTMEITMPETIFTLAGYSDGSNKMTITVPHADMTSTVINVVYDEIFRYVRWRVR